MLNNARRESFPEWRMAAHLRAMGQVRREFREVVDQARPPWRVGGHVDLPSGPNAQTHPSRSRRMSHFGRGNQDRRPRIGQLTRCWVRQMTRSKGLHVGPGGSRPKNLAKTGKSFASQDNYLLISWFRVRVPGGSLKFKFIEFFVLTSNRDKELAAKAKNSAMSRQRTGRAAIRCTWHKCCGHRGRHRLRERRPGYGADGRYSSQVTISQLSSPRI